MTRCLMWSVPAVFALTAMGCAGNESARLLLSEMERTTPQVLADIEKLRQRDENLVALTKLYAQIAASEVGVSTSICKSHLQALRAELAASHAQISDEIIEETLLASGSIEDIVAETINSNGIDARHEALINERDRLRQVAKNAPNDERARLQRYGAEAVFYEYSARVLAATMEAMEQASKAIKEVSEDQRARLKTAVAEKTEELEQENEDCEAVQTVRSDHSFGENLADLNPTDAYTHLSAYVRGIGDASGVFQRQKDFPYKVFDLFLINTFNGLKEGALRLNGAKGASGEELEQQIKDVVVAVTDKGASFHALRNTVNVDAVKRAARLTTIGPDLIDKLDSTIDKTLSHEKGETMEKDAKTHVKDDIGSRERVDR